LTFHFAALTLQLAVAFAETGVTPPPFRLTIASEPASISTLEQRSSGGSYLLNQLHAGLLEWRDGHLNPRLGRCQKTNAKQITCRLRPEFQWSDGQPIEAQQFVNTFQSFLDPKKPGLRADLLFPLENAEAILAGTKGKTSLGVKARSQPEQILEFQLRDGGLADEFLLNLSNPLLAPLAEPENHHPDPLKMKTSGPYSVVEWNKSGIYTLAPNSFHGKNPNRPRLQFRIVTEDAVALTLFQKKELDFLRHLPTLYIPEFAKTVAFHKVPQLRFDYFAFGPALEKFPDLRAALSLSLDFRELKQLFSADEMPGCPGIPDAWYTPQTCIEFDLVTAQARFAKAQQQKTLWPPLRLVYSKAGGEDHDRAAQWLQAQWKKNLGVEVSLAQLDNKVFLNLIKTDPPPLFRRGLSPDRPSCQSVLDSFNPQANEPLLAVKDPTFLKILNDFAKATTAAQKQKLCHLAMENLQKHFILIPTGPLYFSILVNPNWQGWQLNELNQLNLADLHFIAP